MEPLIAAVEHGPGMHGPALVVLAVIALIVGLVGAVRSRNRPAKQSERDKLVEHDQGRGA